MREFYPGLTEAANLELDLSGKRGESFVRV